MGKRKTESGFRRGTCDEHDFDEEHVGELVGAVFLNAEEEREEQRKTETELDSDEDHAMNTSLMTSTLKNGPFARRERPRPRTHSLSSLFLSLALPLFSSAFMLSEARAQDLTHKAAVQGAPTVIVGATVHPVVGAEVPDGVVYFNGGKVAGVYTREAWGEVVKTAVFSPALRVIEAKGKHVYPGLVSPYSQLGLTEISALRQTNDSAETGDVTPEVIAANAVNPDSTLLPVTRSNGILIAGTFPGGGTIPGNASVIRLDGWTTTDMTVVERAGMVLRFPAMRSFSAWWMDRPEGEQQTENNAAMERVKRVFDTASAYNTARSHDTASPVDLRWEAMRPVFAGFAADLIPVANGSETLSVSTPMPLFVLANDLDQINAAVSFCIERNLRCVIVGGRDADRCGDLLKKHGIPVILSGGTFALPRRGDAAYDESYTLPARLHAAGVAFTIAGGDDTAHERNLPYVVAMAVAHGLPHEAGIKAITLDAATILGVGATYGSLEAGKSATLIVTTGSPLEVMTKIEMAFVDGREIDLSNKQTKLFEKYKERYRQTGDLK